MALAVILVSVCYFVIAEQRRRAHAVVTLRLPPGHMEWPIGGLKILIQGFSGLFDFPGDGPYKRRLLFKPAVMLRHPDHVRWLLTADEDTVAVQWPPSTSALLGPNSVSLASGAYHRCLRRLLGPCFSPQAMEGYFPAVQSICERFCAAWAEASQRAVVAGGQQGDLDVEQLPKMQKEARLLAFEVISTVVAGFSFSRPQLQHLSDQFDLFMRGLFSPLPVPLPGSGFARALQARRVIVAVLDKQLDAMEADKAGKAAPAAAAAAGAGKTSGISGSSSVVRRLLDMTDEDGRPLSRRALQDLAVGLLFAGHETTSNSILRLLLNLRSRPDVWARLREEQRRAVERHGEVVTGAALRDMPYLDAVVKETWRLNPLVPAVFRKAERDLKIGGYDVPKGWTILPGLADVTKYDPAWRDELAPGGPGGSPLDPSVFNPDRWQLPQQGSRQEGRAEEEEAAAEESSAVEGVGGFRGGPLSPGFLSSPVGHLPPSMMTFGFGARYCLGANLAWAETKTFMSVLVRKYDIHAPLAHMDVTPFPTLVVTKGFPLEVRPLACKTATTVAVAAEEAPAVAASA